MAIYDTSSLSIYTRVWSSQKWNEDAKLIQYLWAKIEPERSDTRMILPTRISIYIQTISEQTNFAQLIKVQVHEKLLFAQKICEI